MLQEFTKIRMMKFPRTVLAGHGVINQIGEVCEELDFQNPGLIITGPKTIEIAGKKVEELLRAKKFVIKTKVTGEAIPENIEDCVKTAQAAESRFLIGVGGGSKIDITKIVAKRLNLPFVSVPTSASHDGIASPSASIRENNISKSQMATAPMAIIADSALIVKSPYRLLASGCADVISNSTAILDWKLAAKLRNEDFSRSACALSELTANEMIEIAPMIKPNLEESIWLAVRLMIVSGIAMSVAGSSRPTSGSEHMFSHALDMLGASKALHGEQCGVGAIMMMFLHGGDWQRIKNALQIIGAPTTAKELGIEPEIIIKALTIAHKVRPERYTILGDNGIIMDAAERVANVTGVI